MHYWVSILNILSSFCICYWLLSCESTLLMQMFEFYLYSSFDRLIDSSLESFSLMGGKLTDDIILIDGF